MYYEVHHDDPIMVYKHLLRNIYYGKAIILHGVVLDLVMRYVLLMVVIHLVHLAWEQVVEHQAQHRHLFFVQVSLLSQNFNHLYQKNELIGNSQLSNWNKGKQSYRFSDTSSIRYIYIVLQQNFCTAFIAPRF